jgi:hypothetical protein
MDRADARTCDDPELTGVELVSVDRDNLMQDQPDDRIDVQGRSSRSGGNERFGCYLSWVGFDLSRSWLH